MATKQKLRGDGSKEYQVITNLSRGINNAVADDVLIDNAFRDVVNFSSDQLGNINKRDNLINTNFKEFIRKLAYADFDVSKFIINDYVGTDTSNEKKYRYGYKRYSYGKVDQVILRNFYDLLFTNRGYIGNSSDSTPFGVLKLDNGAYMKVPSYAGMSDEYMNIVDNTIDAPISKEEPGTPTEKYYIREHLETTKGEAPYYATLYYTLDDNETKIEIEEASIPEGWVLNESKDTINKTYETAYAEDITLRLKINDDYIEKSTGICVNKKSTLVVKTDFVTRLNAYTRLEDKGDTYVATAYMYSSNLGFKEILGVNGDSDWVVTDIEAIEVGKINDTYPTGPGIQKTFKKSEILETYNKDLEIIGTETHYMTWNLILTPTPIEQDKFLAKTIQASITNCRLQHLQVLEQDNFFVGLQDLDKLFREGIYEDNVTLDKPIHFDAYFILYGDCSYTVNNDAAKSGLTNCLAIYRITIDISINYELTVTVNCKTVGDNAYFPLELKGTYASDSNIPDGFMADLSDEDLTNGLFISKYSNYLYITTGKSSIIRLAIEEDDVRKQISLIGSHNKISSEVKESEGTITYVKLLRSNVYAPVPFEISNPGFNILADDPISYIDMAGTVDAIKGVYYSVTENGIKEPIQNVPYNIAFNIHILMTGDTEPSKPKIRPNNGELDAEKNPYRELAGAWKTDARTGLKYFECSGINDNQAYEMLIEKGTDKFLAYFTPTSYTPKDTGKISELASLVFSCPRSKIINNQLVLFGRGGYLFFSDFDNFKYFPNYYYIYVANGTDEEVVDIIYFRQFYAIFTNKRIVRMSGDFASDNFRIEPLNDFMGCVNHNTIRQVYNSIYFIGYNGIYALNQGYLGTGTENLKRIDTQLSNTFNYDNVSYCYVMGNTYIIIMKDGKTWFTYDVDNDMFLRYSYDLGDNTTLTNVSFVELLEENQIYAILTTAKDSNKFANDLLLYNYPLLKDVNYEYKDGDNAYISAFETPYINLGTPTNTKKFKTLFIKMFNETDSLIPLYITIYVDDIIALSPEDYVIELDEETNIYFYYFKAENNAELLKAHNKIGELTLGKDTLGDNIIQQLKLTVNAKGRAIKVILSDGYDYPNKDSSAIIKYRNTKKFSISTLGIVYKLKKVKEG